MARILVIDDEADLLRALNMILKSRGHDVTALGDAVAASRIIPEGKFDAIISDIRMQPMDGLQLLDFLHQKGVKTPVIMLTAHATLDVALQAIKKGAFDFITKPFKPDALLDMIQQVMEQPVINGADIVLDESAHAQCSWNGIIAKSRQMQVVCNSLRQVAPTDETVVIMGEKGTGKSFFAGLIHSMSARADKPLLTLDCAKLSQDEFFKALLCPGGLLEANPGATILLENIDFLPPAQSEKLSRIIQEKEFSPAGATPVKFDARFLVTCGRSKTTPEWIIALSVLIVTLPPLRERLQDILPLISWQIRKHAPGDASGRPWTVSADAFRMLAQYSWPRNVDEMDEMMQNALKSARGCKLSAGDFPSIRADKVALARSGADSIQVEELRGKSFRDYVRRKQMELKEK